MSTHEEKKHSSYRARKLIEEIKNVSLDNFTVEDLYNLIDLYLYKKGLSLTCPVKEELDKIEKKVNTAKNSKDPYD